jgi:hypothetical protein
VAQRMGDCHGTGLDYMKPERLEASNGWNAAATEPKDTRNIFLALLSD